MAKKKATSARATMSSPFRVCPFCGKLDCRLDNPMTGWPRVTDRNLDFGNGFASRNLRFSPATSRLPAR